MKRLLLLFVTALALNLSVIGLVTSLSPPKAEALSGSSFQAGRIIDDTIFFNGNTLGVDTIQQFLNSKVTVCDTNGAQAYGSTTRAAYGASSGYPPPYTCLKDYTSSTPSKAADAYCGAYGGGMKSSASIIYEVAAACNINPKALLVLLQKEQALVTDDWPWSVEYRSATGFGCPDTAACDSTYYGFFNQVYNAARQFQRYRIQSNLFNYSNGATSFVQYNPNAGCGGTNVTMANQATAGLYNYTPYQPNSAALSNLYGTGDSCSSYGNRNFWRLYNDWFGTPYAQSYAWSTNGYTILNAAKSQTVDPGYLEPGQRYVVDIAAVNTGAATWSNTGYNPVFLGSGSNSRFCTNTWVACNRPALLQEASVAPGQTGHFEFTFQAPFVPGQYRENFKPVAEMLSWFNDDPNGSFGIRVVSPGTFTWSTNGYTILNAAKSQTVDPGRLEPGQVYVATLAATNNGTATWKNNSPNPVLLGMGNNSVFCTNTWVACNRPALLQEASVAPGQTGHFEFTFQAPFVPGQYRETIKPVSEFFTWFNDIPQESFGVWVVNPGTFTWSTNGYTILNAAKSQTVDPGHLLSNQQYVARISAVNTGTATWKNNGPSPVSLAAPSGISALCTSSWLSPCNRLSALQEASVAPGQTGHFEFTFQAPIATGPYRQNFKPVAEMFSWFNDDPNGSFGIWVY